MASHDCPDGYTPIRHHNSSNFLLHNIRDPDTGAYWMTKDAAGEKCDNLDMCDGLIKSGSRYTMRRQLKTDTTYTHNDNGHYEWCVRDLMIESKEGGNIKTVAKRMNAFERGVKSVMNSTLCDTNTTEWKDGKCRTLTKPEDACEGGDLVYDPDTKTCVPTADICGSLTLDAETGRCVANKNVCDDATMTFEDGKCVSTVDVTEDNASVCEGRHLAFDEASGQCAVDSSTVCGRKTKYNAETEQCEKDGGCAIM